MQGPFAEFTLSEMQGSFAEFSLSEMQGFFASLRMTSEGLRSDKRRAQNDKGPRRARMTAKGLAPQRLTNLIQG